MGARPCDIRSCETPGTRLRDEKRMPRSVRTLVFHQKVRQYCTVFVYETRFVFDSNRKVRRGRESPILFYFSYTDRRHVFPRVSDSVKRQCRTRRNKFTFAVFRRRRRAGHDSVESAGVKQF